MQMCINKSQIGNNFRHRYITMTHYRWKDSEFTNWIYNGVRVIRQNIMGTYIFPNPRSCYGILTFNGRWRNLARFSTGSSLLNTLLRAGWLGSEWPWPIYRRGCWDKEKLGQAWPVQTKTHAKTLGKETCKNQRVNQKHLTLRLERKIEYMG